jgi:hypothetical protein
MRQYLETALNSFYFSLPGCLIDVAAELVQYHTPNLPFVDFPLEGVDIEKEGNDFKIRKGRYNLYNVFIPYAYIKNITPVNNDILYLFKYEKEGEGALVLTSSIGVTIEWYRKRKIYKASKKGISVYTLTGKKYIYNF